ncbi:MAG: hypothetical protein WDZ59_15445 [Pirellulales bacterium]
MRIYLILLALFWVLWAGTAHADVVITDTVIDGTYPDAEVRIFSPGVDATTVDMVDGAGLAEAQVFDHSVLNFSGGTLARAMLKDQSTLNLTGGTLSDLLRLDSNSVANFFDGTAPSRIDVDRQSELNIHGADFGEDDGSSLILMRPGDNVVNVHGSGFETDGNLLTGTLVNGDAFERRFMVLGTNPAPVVLHEPGAEPRSVFGFREATIDVGTHELLPNTPGQEIQIYVRGGSMVQGVQIRAYITDGVSDPYALYLDPSEIPRFQDADILTDTSFAESNTGQRGNVVSNVAEAGTTTACTACIVLPDGLLATLTVDTTGIDINDGPFELNLTGFESPLNDVFLPATNWASADLPLTLVDGSIAMTAVGNGRFQDGLAGWSTTGEGSVSETEVDGTTAAMFTTGSPATITQLINTPASPFEVTLDFRFEQELGELSIELADQMLGSLVSDGLIGELQSMSFLVTDPALFGLTGAELGITFDGPESGLDLLLSRVSVVRAEVAPVPEPSTIALAMIAACCIPLTRLRRRI